MKKLLLMSALFLYALGTQQVIATTSSEDKPFAEEKIVLQISDPDPFKQTLVLNVANNLIKHYGQDKVDIEIVAFGPGLKLLLKKNKISPRIDGLADSGVRFAACNNTLAAMTKKLGKTPKLHSSATHVSAGVVRIIDLESEGYKLIKP